jgi:hypothetical protein
LTDAEKEQKEKVSKKKKKKNSPFLYIVWCKEGRGKIKLKV